MTPAMETLFDELKRYVHFTTGDEEALRALHPLAAPEFVRIADVFYQRILEHPEAKKALVGGESVVGRLKVTLVAWMDELLRGPWDEDYYEKRARIGRVHVRIALPQHYMFGAMNVVRQELSQVVEARLRAPESVRTQASLGKILDLELAIMLHTYREDLIEQQERNARLSTFGQLVGSIGHELRNPLGVIESSLYILQGRLGGDERARKHTERIGEQVAIANQIISTLLDMIRDRPLQRQRLRVVDVLDGVLESVKRSPELRISVDGIDGLPEIDGDAVQLRQVLLNLVENATQACSAGGEVWVRGQAVDGVVSVTVEDTGAGVDPSVQRRLFEPLVTTKTKGIGLGLALVRRIVARHGGSVTYEPRPGGGSRFIVRLPAGAAHA
jgi:signal transduction histidine kinase